MQLAPDALPRRLKCGWSKNPIDRLRAHRTAAPTAALLASWECPKQYERRALSHVAGWGYPRIGPEVFDVQDSQTLIARLGRWFSAALAPKAGPLALARKRSLLTQQELARKAGLSVLTVSQIESGARKRPAIRTIRALSAALGLPPTEIDEFRASLGLS